VGLTQKSKYVRLDYFCHFQDKVDLLFKNYGYRYEQDGRNSYRAGRRKNRSTLGRLALAKLKYRRLPSKANSRIIFKRDKELNYEF
jgi:hypothetical protein